jgi:hypothetical protein
LSPPSKGIYSKYLKKIKNHFYIDSKKFWISIIKDLENKVKNEDIAKKKGALDSQPHVIEFTSCLPMVGGSPRVPWLLPPLKLVTMI